MPSHLAAAGVGGCRSACQRRPWLVWPRTITPAPRYSVLISSLDPGATGVEYFLKAGPTTAAAPIATIDIASEHGKKVHAQRHLEPTAFADSAGYQRFSLTFDSDTDVSECEFRVIAYGRGALYIDRIELECLR